MTVIREPDEPLQLICSRCGRCYPDVEMGSSDELRWDAWHYGWSYSPAAPYEDLCPQCIQAPLDETHQQWIYEEERVRDE